MVRSSPSTTEREVFKSLHFFNAIGQLFGPQSEKRCPVLLASDTIDQICENFSVLDRYRTSAAEFNFLGGVRNNRFSRALKGDSKPLLGFELPSSHFRTLA